LSPTNGISELAEVFSIMKPFGTYYGRSGAEQESNNRTFPMEWQTKI
jgi:hypothetical protein